MIWMAMLLAAQSGTGNAYNTAMRERLDAHVTWRECVQAQSARLSASTDSAGDVADAVLGSCSHDETTVFLRQSAALRAAGENGATIAEEMERTMERWRGELRREALSIIVGYRVRSTEAANAGPLPD